MKNNKTYKRFDSDTYRRVMSMLIYLESIEVKDIVRHVDSHVYYRVRVDGYFTSLDKVSNIMKNLPKRYVTAFDIFMGKVFKRVLRRVHTFYRYEFYTISFLMDYIQANSYIVPIGLEDIECVRMYAESTYDKDDALKLVDTMLHKKSEVEDILGDTVVNNKNSTIPDKEDLDKNFSYLKETLLRLYIKGYNTLEVGDNIIAVVQDYTQADLDSHVIKRKTYLNITSTFDLLDLYRPLRRGVYSIKDILNLPNAGDIVYMGDKPYYLHSISSNDVGTQYFLYPNHLNKEMYELLGRYSNLEMTYKVRLAKKNNTCNMFTDGYQEEWNRFIGGL